MNKLTNNSQNIKQINVYISSIYIILLILGLWGCMAIYSATYNNSQPLYYVIKQIIWLGFAYAVLYLSSEISFKYYKKYSIAIAAFSWTLLILVLYTGTKINGMRGWFDFDVFFLQPSELCKTPLILLTASVLLKGKNDRKNFLRLSMITALWLIPVLLQPDIGTVIVYLSGITLTYITCCKNWKYIFYWVLPGITAFSYILLTKPYVTKRFAGFLWPDNDIANAGWHVKQFQYTLARGGLTGTNWGNAIWANTYLPLPHSDSAYASIAEAIGFLGIFVVCIGFASLVYICFKLVEKTKSRSAKIFIIGIAMMFAAQTLIHMAVNVTLLPPTGITLPILSYGGSSLVSTMLAFGLVISAAKSSLRIKKTL